MVEFFLFQMAVCEDREVLLMLRDIMGSNISAWHDHLAYNGPCSELSNTSFSTTLLNLSSKWSNSEDYKIGKDVYAYLTPLIIVVGIIGNLTSLRIFTMRSMRVLSAGLYLAAISASDLFVILTYVLLEWLAKGLPRLNGQGIHLINTKGICQLFLLLSYTLRFTSVWLITVFTIERYIAIDKPLHRKVLCTRALSRKLICSVFGVAILLSMYKPLLSGQTVYNPKLSHSQDDKRLYNPSDVPLDDSDAKLSDVYVCSSMEEHKSLNFYLDSIYGCTITIVPFIIITIFNSLILRSLLRKSHPSPDVKPKSSRENRLRVEFTVILLAISTSLICLNLPYFIVWLQQFILSADQQFTGKLQDPEWKAEMKSDLFYLTKTIFFINYSINFFLYALTGKQYRLHLKAMFTCKKSVNFGQKSSIRTHVSNSLATDAYGTFPLKTMV